MEGVDRVVALLSPDGRVLDIDATSSGPAGAGAHVPAGAPFAESRWFTHAGDREAVARAIRDAVHGRRVVRLRVRHPDGGDPPDVELRIAPLSDDGRVVALVASVRDAVAERAQARSERLLEAVIGSVPDAIITIDAAHRMRMVNPGAEAMFGYARDELLGQPLDILLPEDARAGHPARVHAFRDGDKDARFMHQRRPVAGRRRDGSVFPAEITIARSRLEGEVLFTAVLRDITDRQRVQRELAEATQQEEAILRSVADGVVGIDRAGRTTFANPAAARLLGYRVHELIGRDMHALIHHSRPDGSAYPVEACPTWASIHAGQAATCDDDVYWRADGTPLPVEYTTTPFRIDGRVEGAVIVFRDISARRRAEAELLQLSLVDELTGLYNRRGFMLHAKRALERVRLDGLAATLAFFDMDRFKAINDTHGHLAGDQALREVATLLRRALRRDDVLGRFGGDEFVALLSGRPEDDMAAQLQARIEAQLAHRNSAPDTPFALAMSVGTVRLAPGERRDVEQLLMEADAALYRAKRARPPTPT